MAESPVLLDSSGLLALINRQDSNHERAKSVERELTRQRRALATSEWVLSEMLGWAARTTFRRPAVELISRLKLSRRTTIIPASHDGWERAFELFSRRTDKEWSFVDCSSILICRDLGVEAVFTHDHHFEQAGFRVLLWG